MSEAKNGLVTQKQAAAQLDVTERQVRRLVPIPIAVWESLTLEQQGVMRFPIGD